MKDYMKYLSLKEMLVPKFLNIIYWIISIMVILTGITSLLGGLYLVSFKGIIYGLIGIIVGLIITRIIFEFIYVVFGIYENTKK